MERMMRKVWSRKKGFTLIELLIVVAIIGILAGIAIPNFLGAREKAKVAKAFSDMDALAKAQEMYYLDNTEYATALDSLGPTYINSVPSTDPWGNSYRLYTSPSTTPTMFVIIDNGPDTTTDVTTSTSGWSWSDDDRVRGPIGGSDGVTNAYGISGTGASKWYNPSSGVKSRGDIGYGGG